MFTYPNEILPLNSGSNSKNSVYYFVICVAEILKHSILTWMLHKSQAPGHMGNWILYDSD